MKKILNIKRYIYIYSYYLYCIRTVLNYLQLFRCNHRSIYNTTQFYGQQQSKCLLHEHIRYFSTLKRYFQSPNLTK